MAGRARFPFVMRRAGLLMLALILFAACTSNPQETVPSLAVLPTSTLAPPTFTPIPINRATLPPAPLTPVPINTSMPAVSDTPPPVTSIAALVGNINVTSAPGITLRRAPSDAADVIAVLP
ncbi:MAG TPA: hypothetical protein VHD90_26130, partial [Phototrophicaceae bacterium]|nr:hypothetical protein [Phototrophicaceae bacterium]